MVRRNLNWKPADRSEIIGGRLSAFVGEKVRATPPPYPTYHRQGKPRPANERRRRRGGGGGGSTLEFEGRTGGFPGTPIGAHIKTRVTGSGEISLSSDDRTIVRPDAEDYL